MTELVPQTERDREILQSARQQGTAATLKAFLRLSGPGWLQSAITLGGGSLASALFLGILGGFSLLWLQLVAIVMGVIMLSAISYVTLTTGERPFRAINQHVNPVLGWGWIIATMLANVIWCMPQFSLCFEAIQKNLLPGVVDPENSSKFLVSGILLAAGLAAVYLNNQGGFAAKIFDGILKALIGMVVVCFVGVVVLLTLRGQLDWSAVVAGFLPDFSGWNRPTGRIHDLLATLPEPVRQFWNGRLVAAQRQVMISAAATAVGINMTFLMPYSLLRRGWDRNFRGLARFDLCTGMAIPYVLVTSCVVIAAASRFHATADAEFLSTDPAVMQTSPLYRKDTLEPLRKSLQLQLGSGENGRLSESELLSRLAAMPDAEKLAAVALVKRSGFDLSAALAPLLGPTRARLAFGLGIFGMGFSTIIILMLINGFALCEMTNRPGDRRIHSLGCLMAGIAGMCWPLFWQGETQMYLAIIASTFGSMLLPIAYFTFLLMMNSRTLMGDEKPTGVSMVVWNLLMGISTLGAAVAAGSALHGEAQKNPGRGMVIYAVAGLYLLLVAVGFLRRRTEKNAS